MLLRKMTAVSRQPSVSHSARRTLPPLSSVHTEREREISSQRIGGKRRVNQLELERASERESTYVDFPCALWSPTTVRVSKAYLALSRFIRGALHTCTYEHIRVVA